MLLLLLKKHHHQLFARNVNVTSNARKLCTPQNGTRNQRYIALRNGAANKTRKTQIRQKPGNMGCMESKTDLSRWGLVGSSREAKLKKCFHHLDHDKNGVSLRFSILCNT